MRRLSIFLLLSFFFFPSPLAAQEVEQLLDLSITATPSNPKAGEQVTLEAVSYSVDLYQSTLTWTQDGRVVTAGFGKTKITVTAPASGRISTIAVSVTGTGISPVATSITLRPGSIDMLWEAVDSSAPPFYKGRRLLAPNGLFRIVAVPALGAPQQSTFMWSRNNSTLASASGTGRSSVVLEHSILNTQEKIGLSVTGGAFQGAGELSIVPRTPFVVGYQKREGFIDYANGSTRQITINGPGGTLYFEPFSFFSLPAKKLTDLSFLLRFGEEPIYGEDRPNELRLSSPGAGVSSNLVVELRALEGIQRVSQPFDILFTE